MWALYATAATYQSGLLPLLNDDGAAATSSLLQGYLSSVMKATGSVSTLYIGFANGDTVGAYVANIQYIYI